MKKIGFERVRQFSSMLRTRFLTKSRKNLTPLIFAVAFCVFNILIYTTVSVSMFSTTIGSGGTVKTVNVGVYWDEGCSDPVSYLDWGVVEPGSQKDLTIYIKNEANVPVTLSLGTVSWDPVEASSYITLSWDYSDQLLELDASIEVTLTLSISSSLHDIDNFNFGVVIAGSG
jgi:hypothetical protein